MNDQAKNILNELLADIPDDINKREGSVVYTILAPVAMKLAQKEKEDAAALSETYVDTAPLDDLILRAKERNVEYLPETKAIIEAVIELADGDSVEGGERFFTADGGVGYIVVSMSDDGTVYQLECEEYGTKGNIESGKLIFDGRGIAVKSAEIKNVFTYGRNAETADSLRQRYYESFDASAFGGNIADYREKCLEKVSGVGGVQVRRAWNGGGTVKLVLVSNEFTAITEESGIIAKAQNLFDPEKTGDGTGLAPIDHIVTVVSADETAVDIVSNIEFENGVSLSDIIENAKKALQLYFASLCKAWSENGKAVVRIGKIESVLSSVNGIVDAYDTTINGKTSNIEFSGDYIPVLGTVNGL